MQPATPATFKNVTTASSIAAAFWERAAETPDAPVYRYAVASSTSATRIWRSETYASCSVKIARLAHFLADIGVGVGTPVAILSNTRPEWMIADMAIQTLGAVTVSIYQSLPAHEVGFILYDSGASVLLIENEEQAQKLWQLYSGPCPIPAREDLPASEAKIELTNIVTFEPLLDLLSTPVPAIPFDAIVDDASEIDTPPPLPALTRESLSSIVYTSGTTGPPKGVLQSHGNHLTNVAQVAESGVFLLDGSLFLYLPLAHSFARLAYYVGFLTSAWLVLPAVTDHHSSRIDLASIARDMSEGSPSVVPSVPRLFEKIASMVKVRGNQHTVLRVTLRNAERVYAIRAAGGSPSLWQRLLYKLCTPVRAMMKEKLFGTRFSHGISGGAKLDPGVNRFFEALGVTVCEGYGLTETCVATHVNLPNNHLIGSVGPALAGVEVRITPEDGEILLRGPNVTRGYHNRRRATAEAWDAEGWFHSGDIGRVDENGFLYITDRKKELIITAGGKKVAPQGIEGLFKRHPFVSHAFLYGEGRPYCVMLLTLNEHETRAMMQDRGITVTAETQLAHLEPVQQLVATAVEQTNQELASYETIKRFILLKEDFTIENGLLTPTLKMKRKLIVARYSSEIESLYA
jgi:long-chain acyl-CoA synthetase